jgi:hypothetical protein
MSEREMISDWPVIGPEPGTIEGELCSADAAAIDALFESGLDPERIGEVDSPQRGRARAAAELLRLLECPVEPHAALADVAFHRVLQVRRATRDFREAELTEDDQIALDSWVMGGFDAERAPGALRERARRHEALAGLVTRCQGAGPDLADRTLEFIQAEINAEETRHNIVDAPQPRGRSIRLADLVSVAAVLLIGAGVLMPVLTAVRDQGRRAMCLSNLGGTATAMGIYAGSNRDSMPLSTASLGGGRWWEVGKPHSNSANLFTLARMDYTPLSMLACAGNPVAETGPVDPNARDWRSLEEISYSYQIMFGRERPLWGHGARTVVLADRSPVVLRSVRGEQFDPMANAPNHRSRGQHLLYNDGSSEWARSPMLENGDNIWLSRQVEIGIDLMAGRPIRPLTGREIPDAADDACLGP